MVGKGMERRGDEEEGRFGGGRDGKGTADMGEKGYLGEAMGGHEG